MENLFESFSLGSLDLANRFVFPPIKLGCGKPDGEVTDWQIRFYRNIARNGPAVVILEPVSVTADGKEHPRQLCVHLPDSTQELGKLVDAVHGENRLACLHLNHAGAAANPKATGSRPRAPSSMTCARSGEASVPLDEGDIARILEGYESATWKAVDAGFDLIELQGGHGYLLSQFLNRKTNKRSDAYGSNRLLFAREVFSRVGQAAGNIPIILRISGSEMSPEFGIPREDLLPLIRLAEESGVCAIHVGMGNSCFSPAWYFHHGSLPLEPQEESLSWLRSQTIVPLIAAGRMGRRSRIGKVLDKGLTDMFALGRPLIADPDLIGKWKGGKQENVVYCGYCLQGCLHRLKSGEPLGCNLNPEIDAPPMQKTDAPHKILVVGGGPAGMSAAFYLTRRGHEVTLVEKTGQLGGQFDLAWQAPGKRAMKDGLSGLRRAVEGCGARILLRTGRLTDAVRENRPDVIVWATGARPTRPTIRGLDKQYAMTALELLHGEKEVRGPRVLVIGAGRVGLEIAEMLGKKGLEIVGTKRTDPLGGMMEMITRKLALIRIDQLPNVKLMAHTSVKAFADGSVEVEQDGARQSLEPFQTIILATGMKPSPRPDEETRNLAQKIEVIGDAEKVRDIYTAVHAGYQVAQRY